MERNFKQLIEAYDTIIIHRHQKPDGDALGSQIGLKEAILANYPEKRVLVTGDENEKYKFIGKMDEVRDEDYNDALAFVVDTSEETLVSDTRYKLAKYLNL